MTKWLSSRSPLDCQPPGVKSFLSFLVLFPRAQSRVQWIFVKKMDGWMGMVSTGGVAFWLFTGPEGFHLSVRSCCPVDGSVNPWVVSLTLPPKQKWVAWNSHPCCLFQSSIQLNLTARNSAAGFGHSFPPSCHSFLTAFSDIGQEIHYSQKIKTLPWPITRTWSF